MVKWLTNITISETESQSYYHFFDNRNLHSITPERADREGWWYKPEFIINDLNLNSAITHPVNGSVLRVQLAPLPVAVLMPRHHTHAYTQAHDEEIPLLDHGTYTMQGYAYCGGGRRVHRVELSLDDGQVRLRCLSCLHTYRMMIVWLLDWC